MKKIKIGLFFGSFNPVHIGHMVIANHMAEYSDLEKVWMVISPQNPFKKKNSLASNYDRLHLLSLAIGDNLNLKASKIEFNLPVPSYTIDTLAYLKEYHPENEYVLIMGSDNLGTFHKWKNYELILTHHHIYIYQRPGYSQHLFEGHDKIKFFEAPLLDISATYIRNAIKENKSIQYLVPEEVYEYLRTSHLYKK